MRARMPTRLTVEFWIRARLFHSNVRQTNEDGKEKRRERDFGSEDEKRNEIKADRREERDNRTSEKIRCLICAEEDLDSCLQNQASGVCLCKSPCTGQKSKIEVVTLTVLVSSLYCQNCVCVCACVCLCQCP